MSTIVPLDNRRALIRCDATTAVVLPAPGLSVPVGYEYKVIDSAGSAAGATITVTAPGSTVRGTATISAAYGELIMTNDGTDWISNKP